jgi:hypothetical protein
MTKMSGNGPTGLSKSLSKKKKPSGKKKSGSKKKIRHMHIEPADNGGFNVRHMYDQGGPDEEPTPDSTHALSDPSQLLGHVQDNFGGEMPQAGGAAPAGPPQAGM